MIRSAFAFAALALSLVAAYAPAATSAQAASAGENEGLVQPDAAMEQKLERFGALSERAGRRLGSGTALSAQDEVVLAVGSLSQDVMSDRKISPAEARKMLAQVRRSMCGAGSAPGVACDEIDHDVKVLDATYADAGEPSSDMVPSALRLMVAVVDWVESPAAPARR